MTEAAPNPVQAFADAGLWKGLGRTIAGGLAAAGITEADHVTVGRLTKIPTVTPARGQKLVTAFLEAAEVFDVVCLLAPAGVFPRLAGRVSDVLSPGAAQALRSDPWRMLDAEGTRLSDADKLAASLGITGPETRALRGRAVVVDALRNAAAREGSTAAEDEDIARAAADAGADAAQGIEAAVDDGRVVRDGRLLALSRYAEAEAAVAAALVRLSDGAEAFGSAKDAPNELDAAQHEAVGNALEHGVSLLTGGPGTGKSRTVDAVVHAAKARGKRVALAAPTGRAAKRLEEVTGFEAMTVHRLLGAQGRTGGFTRNEAWPLDADLVVVDEVSMLDVELAAALVNALPTGAHLMLVGDPAQLASVGPGRVLGDLLDARWGDGQRIPMTELATLYRQAEGGAIARLATGVRAGELPTPPPPEECGFEVVVVPVKGSEEAAKRVVQLVTQSIPGRLGIGPADIQVVTPVHKGGAGTQALNRALKEALNPGPGAHGGFDPGDRVVATANRLDHGFANGEVGTVLRFTAAGQLEVAFTTGTAELPPGTWSDLTHGWALTVHRAQGSEWPAVVAVLPAESGPLLSRPLVYTAFTRARQHLSVVSGLGPALGRAVGRIGARPRTTRLQALLERELSRAAGGPARS